MSRPEPSRAERPVTRLAREPGRPQLDDFDEHPGLVQGYQLEQVITAGHRYFIEDAGQTTDGRRLWRVYYQRLSGEVRA